MAKKTGYECDVCKNFSTNREGWVTVTPHATGVGDSEFDVCSADCIVRFGVERGGAVGKRAKTGTSVLAGKPAKRYDDDLKLSVAAYADEHGDSAAADKFGVSYDSARRWREALKEG